MHFFVVVIVVVASPFYCSFYQGEQYSVCHIIAFIAARQAKQRVLEDAACVNNVDNLACVLGSVSRVGDDIALLFVYGKCQKCK